MNSLTTLTENQIQTQVKDLTSEKILGLPELERYEYSDNEIKAIKLEMLSLAGCKNENYSELTINSWINEFSLLNMKPLEVLKRVRLAKHVKKYGVSEFAMFMDVNLNQFSELYKYHKKVESENGKTIYAKPKKSYTGFREGNLYEILEQSGNQILLENEEKKTAFYPKEFFEIVESII